MTVLNENDAIMKKIHDSETVCGEFSNDMLRCFYQNIMEKQEVNNWIPCSERMPSNYDTVLIAILSKNGYDEPAYYVTIGFVKNKTEFDCYVGDICDGEKVTHWMPLPNPPEVSEND